MTTLEETQDTTGSLQEEINGMLNNDAQYEMRTASEPSNDVADDEEDDEEEYEDGEDEDGEEDEDAVEEGEEEE